jgi:hypothetical protein
MFGRDMAAACVPPMNASITKGSTAMKDTTLTLRKLLFINAITNNER